MPLFKYIVANPEGKKLSGTVEAPEEKTARAELNNLGFSILELTPTQEQPLIDPSQERFIFEAIDKNNKLVSGTIPANDETDAFTKLQSQYSLRVSAIWPQDSSPEQIEAARQKGAAVLQTQLAPDQKQEIMESQTKSLEEEKKEAFVKAKIEDILAKVNLLLQKFEKEIDPDQKALINKKIDKLLRIKHSTNLDYILETAEELLKFIEDQEKTLQEKGLQDQRFELKLQTKNLLSELHQEQNEKSLSEDIVSKIENWQSAHKIDELEVSTGTKLINKILDPVKKFFKTPPEIAAIKEQIKVYNKQIWEFIKLYFKEPTPEYKAKVKQSIKTIWKARKKAKQNLKVLKKELRNRKKENQIEEHLFISFIEELNSLSGWLLSFYIIYYFSSLYLQTKDFGLNEIPKGFNVYESQFFKYILVILFLLHACTALKVNFFKKNILASLSLPIIFIFTSIVAVLNF